MPRCLCLSRRSPVSGGPPSPAFVGSFFVCLLVRSTDQEEDRHQEVHRLAVPHARVELCVPEYSEYSVSTPSVPPRVQVPHVHLRYCGVLRGTHRDEDRPGASSTLARTRSSRASGTCGGGRARSPRCVAEGLCRMLQRGASTTAPALPAVPSGCQVCAGRDPARCSHQACKPAGGGLSPAGSYVRSD